jgi:hypothetical protein
MKIRRASATAATETLDDPADDADTDAAVPRIPADAEPAADEQVPETDATAELARHAADLKRDLVAFAQAGRFALWRDPFIARSLYGNARVGRPAAFPEPTDREFLRVLDDFVMTFRFPDGSGIVEKFLKANEDLSGDDKKLLKAWRDSVDGIFEVEHKNEETTELTLRNLIDDLEYRVYLGTGPAGMRAVRGAGFVFVRLAPLRAAADATVTEVLGGLGGDAWIVSGPVHAFPRSASRQIAQTALRIAVQFPERVFRNPAMVDEARAMLTAEREAFVEFFGADEVILAPKDAEDRLSEFYRQTKSGDTGPAAGHGRKSRLRRRGDGHAGAHARFHLPEDWESAETIGLVYDETGGLAVLADYGLLHDLFKEPGRAGDKRYAAALKRYLSDDAIPPFALRRLARTYPKTTDEVYRKVQKKPTFTWAKDGDALLRKQKSSRDGGTIPALPVFGARLRELAFR